MLSECRRRVVTLKLNETSLVGLFHVVVLSWYFSGTCSTHSYEGDRHCLETRFLSAHIDIICFTR